MKIILNIISVHEFRNTIKYTTLLNTPPCTMPVLQHIPNGRLGTVGFAKERFTDSPDDCTVVIMYYFTLGI